MTNLWNTSTLRHACSGPFAGDYYHPDFQKDYPEMAAKIETAGAAKNKLVLQEILTPALTSVRQFMQTLTCFPQKLHYFLSTGVHDLNLESVLSWKADGKAFVVYNAQEFESRGLSELFGFPGYTAFQMQLVHQYGFNQTKDDRLLDSADIYTHPQFVRDFPEWSVQIQRMQQPTGPKRKKKQQPHAVPSPVGTSTPNTSSGAASVASSVDEQHRALQPRNSTTSPESVSTDLAASAAPKRSKPRKRCRLAGEPMPKNYFPFKLHTVISLCEKLGYQVCYDSFMHDQI